ELDGQMKELLSSTQVCDFLGHPQAAAAVHLVGAGGCGMSGLGHLLLDLGFELTGSDLIANQEVRQLQDRGAQTDLGHAAKNIGPQTRLVVYSSAIRPDNAELKAAASLNIPTVRRAVLLAGLFHRQRGICVAGMHGKTTTSALLAYALEQLNSAP